MYNLLFARVQIYKYMYIITKSAFHVVLASKIQNQFFFK